ncbi:MAG TPA: glycosyltransferase, partial [Vicinamibacterales bacterium]|nr:glycosyltransferase [Vicinamibacterales bacterium]
MRIALVSSLVSPIRDAAANGPHSIVVDLARGLGSRGHAVAIYAARGSAADGVEIREVDVDPDVRRATFRPGHPAPATALAALERGFERVFELVAQDGADVVSQHAFDAPAITLSERLPALHTLHLPPIADDVVAAARRTQRPIASVSHAASASWRDAIACDVLTLRNGVPSPPDRLLSARPIADLALIAGRISPEKGTDVAIRVARRAGMRPLVVGDVYDEGYFEARVRPLLRESEFVGAVRRAQLAQLMVESAVLLMPIRWDEPFGLVAAEAQMVGCPVAGYRRGALPEVVQDGVGGALVPADDED